MRQEETGMKHLRYFGTAVIAATLVACAPPEKFVIEKYFQAVNSKDNDTLTSFALVGFDKKVDAWEIKKSSPETKDAAPLADLVKKAKDLEARLAENKKKYNAYFLDHMNEVDEVRTAKKNGGAVPGKLSAVAQDWDKFTETEKDIKRQLADAKSAVEKEKRTMMVSVGNVDDVDSLQGDAISKQVDLQLTIGGQPQAYVMTLKKYDVKTAAGARPASRWIVANLKPA